MRLDAAPVLTVDDLSFRYSAASPLVLNHVSFQLSAGELLLLVGSSGSGKSTLALCLTGIIPGLLEGEFSGRVNVNGLDTTRTSVATIGASAGLVFQDPDSQFCNLYVDDELAFGLENQLVPRAEIRRRVDETLALVGITHLRERPVAELSGGQKQRVAIASVLASHPKVVILDEPTSNLDPEAAANVFAFIRELRSESDVAVIVIENRIDDVIEMADRLAVLASGRLIADGPPREVFEELGEELLESGVQLPGLVHAGLVARAHGLGIARLPLTVSEAAGALAPLAKVIDWPGPTPPADTGSVITVDSLSHTYPTGERALEDVSFTVARGDVVGLLGSNGSGKTTLALNLVGLLKPTTGEIEIDGRTLSTIPRRELARIIGYVFQYPEHQFVANSVFEEVAFGLRAWKIAAEEELRERVAATLASFQLTGVQERHPFSLSTGEKRRLSVASMLVLEPQVLILDEPTTGQDRRNIEEMAALMREVNAQGITVLVITHDLAFVHDQTRTCVVLDHGRLVWTGPTERLTGELVRLDYTALRTLQLDRVWERLGAAWNGRRLPRTPAALDLALSGGPN